LGGVPTPEWGRGRGENWGKDAKTGWGILKKGPKERERPTRKTEGWGVGGGKKKKDRKILGTTKSKDHNFWGVPPNGTWGGGEGGPKKKPHWELPNGPNAGQTEWWPILTPDWAHIGKENCGKKKKVQQINREWPRLR